MQNLILSFLAAEDDILLAASPTVPHLTPPQDFNATSTVTHAPRVFSSVSLAIVTTHCQQSIAADDQEQQHFLRRPCTIPPPWTPPCTSSFSSPLLVSRVFDFPTRTNAFQNSGHLEAAKHTDTDLVLDVSSIQRDQSRAMRRAGKQDVHPCLPCGQQPIRPSRK